MAAAVPRRTGPRRKQRGILMDRYAVAGILLYITAVLILALVTALT